MSIFDRFRKKPTEPQPEDPDSNIEILSKPGPLECGGTYATQDRSAPKVIESDEMTLFDVTSALGFPRDRDDKEHLSFVSAFAVPAYIGDFAYLGVFMFLAKCGMYRCPEEETRKWALVGSNHMTDLVQLVKDHDLARDNGYHSRTHGLPEDFGGSVRIEYAGGERISFSDNQSPILRLDAAGEIVRLFEKAMSDNLISLPRTDTIREIRFDEERKDGGYTRSVLTFNPDGTGSNHKQSKYDGPTVYESTKPVDAETVADIMKNIDETGILAWQYLPSNGHPYGAEKKITFVFEDGSEACVRGDRLVPDQLGRGFFDIELEMTTKN